MYRALQAQALSNVPTCWQLLHVLSEQPTVQAQVF